jgi:hypothetical protein
MAENIGFEHKANMAGKAIKLIAYTCVYMNIS